MCCRFFICSITGFVTSGWQWPTLIVTTAEKASRYFLPVSSYTNCISPFTMLIGKYFIVLGRMYSSRIFPTWSGVNVSVFFICIKSPFCFGFAHQHRQDPVHNKRNKEADEPGVAVQV